MILRRNPEPTTNTAKRRSTSMHSHQAAPCTDRDQDTDSSTLPGIGICNACSAPCVLLPNTPGVAATLAWSLPLRRHRAWRRGRGAVALGLGTRQKGLGAWINAHVLCPERRA